MKVIDKLLNYTNNDKKIKTAILMSGKGTNAVNILENQNRFKKIIITDIISDNPKSNCVKIAKNFNKKSKVLDYSNYDNRDRFFRDLLGYLNKREIQFLLYAGFMKIAPGFFILSIPGINSHPADLTILDSTTGLPKYRGMLALDDSFKNEDYVTNSIHTIEEEVDTGVVLALGKKIYKNELPKNIDIKTLHNKIKINSEYESYIKVLEQISNGKLNKESIPYIL